MGAIRAACRPASAALSIASSATRVLPEPTSPCSSRSIRRGAARSRSISASAWTWEGVGVWPKRAQRLAPAAARRPRWGGRAAARVRGCASRPWRPGAPAARRRRGGARGASPGISGGRPAPRAGRRGSRASPRASAKAASSCHSGRSGTRSMRRRSAPLTCPGNSPAVRGHTGSSPASSPGGAGRDHPVRLLHLSPGRRRSRSCRTPPDCAPFWNSGGGGGRNRPPPMKPERRPARCTRPRPAVPGSGSSMPIDLDRQGGHGAGTRPPRSGGRLRRSM